MLTEGINSIQLVIGNHGVKINSGRFEFHSELPICHHEFINHNGSEHRKYSEPFSILKLDVSIVPEIPGAYFSKAICQTKIWELWEDMQGRQVFYSPLEKPTRIVVVEPDFSKGKILILASDWNNQPFYPLIYLDMIIFSNWLAKTGELILHASGISYDGWGYAFVGKSGVGKSTLVSDIADIEGINTLGEDQVILRIIDGEYWIFGTPWHINPRRCSPEGAKLKSLFFLDRYADQVLTRVTAAQTISGIMRSAFIPYYRPSAVEKILENLTKVCTMVPCYTLAYDRGSNILPVIIKGDSQGL